MRAEIPVAALARVDARRRSIGNYLAQTARHQGDRASAGRGRPGKATSGGARADRLCNLRSCNLSGEADLAATMVASAPRLLRTRNSWRTFGSSTAWLLPAPLFSHTPP